MKIIYVHLGFKGNVGDALISQCGKKFLRDYFPGAKIHSLKLGVLLKRHFPRYFYARFFRFILESEFTSSILTFLRKRRIVYRVLKHLRSEECKRVLQLMNRYDAVVLFAGGLFFEQHFPLERRILSNLRVPLYLYGVGYHNPLYREMQPQKLPGLSLLLKKCAAVSVRDDQTRKIIESHSAHHCYLTGDSTLGLYRKHIPKMRKTTDLCIGLNFTAISSDMERAVRELFPRIVDQALWTFGGSVDFVYFVHTSSVERDLAREVLGEFSFVRIISGSYQKIYQQYRTIDICINMMLHSQIFSIWYWDNSSNLLNSPFLIS